MCSARIRPLGLRARFVLWSSLVLAASLAVGFGWVHQRLRGVLDARNDAFLERQAAELLAGVVDHRPGDTEALEAEIRREIPAHATEGLVIIVRYRDRVAITPSTDVAGQLADHPIATGPPRTVWLSEARQRYRALAAPSPGGTLTLVLGISLAETEATLGAFDRSVAGGALAFLFLSIVGGLFFSRQALRPITRSIRAAHQLDTANLTERLPLTGAGDEIDELATTINNLLDRLTAYHAQIIRFTADASHELRSPLAAMRAAVEVTLHQPREVAEYRQTLATLGEQCEHLTALINSLLLLARADTGEINLVRAVVDLAELVGDVAEMFEPLADERGIRLVAAPLVPSAVAGDPARLRQLIINLVDNAVRFTEPGGSVTLQVHTGADRAVLGVTDTGIGIAPEHLPFVFERFYQADAARGSGGCGLGLSICRWIVAAHGGTITVRSRPGTGTEFLVDLPALTASPAEIPLVATASAW